MPEPTDVATQQPAHLSTVVDVRDPPARRAVGLRRVVRRRVVLTVAGGVSILAVIVAAVALVSMGSLRARFDQGRVQLERAEAALVAGNFVAARRDFDRAGSSFRAATAGRAWTIVGATGWVPYVGRTSRTLRAVAGIGHDVSRAGATAAAPLARLPGGLAALGPKDGTIPTDVLRTLGPSIHRARQAVDRARAAAERLPSSWVIAPVAHARDVVQAKLAQAAPIARAADALVHAIPGFAGDNGPKRYFVAVQNTAELRGTGGLVGNYAVLTLDRGRVSLSAFSDIGTLRNLPVGAVAPPTADYGRLYDAFGGPGFWLNLNMTPDAPTAARAIEALYRRDTGASLDGVVFFDLQGLADLLRATGPVTVPEMHQTFASTNVVQAVAASTYLQAHLRDPFTEGPRLIAQTIWAAFLDRARPRQSLRALVGAAASGDLRLYANDPATEAAFRQAGVAGLYRSGPGDQFGVVMSNAAANKVDASLRERVSYDVHLRQGGMAMTTASASIRNDVPAGVAPSYSLGPSAASRAAGLDLVPGEGRWWTSFYCAAECTVVGSRSGHRPFPFEAGREHGLRVYSNFLDAPPQHTATATLSLVSRHVWSGGEASGSYRLVVHAQPTVSPTVLTVTIHAPAGMGICWTSHPMRVRGGVATWTGLGGTREVLQVRFQRSFLGRIGGRIWQFLDRPAFRL